MNRSALCPPGTAIKPSFAARILSPRARVTEQLAACVATDAEQYTSVVEDMAPSEVVALVNRYFTELFGAVFAHGGHVADVKGDGMLAVWTGGSAGDGRLRRRVCRACVDLLAASERFNDASPARRLPTRIGVDFGPVALAPVGALACFELRAVGDTVNTSSRLEQLNKALGTRILVSEAVAEGIHDFVFRDLGCFALRGKRIPVRVFELVAPAEEICSQQEALCRLFASALQAYEQRRLATAIRSFRALALRFPQDGPTRYFLAQCLGAQVRQRKEPAALPPFRGLPHPTVGARSFPLGASA
jgi:adenylate cyclase